MKFEDHVTARSAAHPQPAGGAFPGMIGGHHLDGRFIDLQIIAGQQRALHFADDDLQPVRPFFHPAAQRLAWKVQSQPRKFLLLPIQRHMIVELVQHHRRHQAGAGGALLDDLRRQGRDAHAALAAGTGQLGPLDLGPHHLGRNVFVAFADFATDLAFRLAAVRTNLLGRFDPFGDRFQFLDRQNFFGRTGNFLFFHHHIFRAGRLGGTKEREENLFLGISAARLPLGSRTIEGLLQLTDPPE